MKFTALLYKELREIRPLVLGISILLLLCGFLVLWTSNQPQLVEYRYQEFNSGDVKMILPTGDPDVQSWNLFKQPFINPAGIMQFIFVIVAGITMAVRHFWTEFYTKSWGFLLHRSTSRSQILIAKIVSAIIGFLPFVAIWFVFYLYGHNKAFFPVPPSGRVLVCGFVFVGIGFVSYLAVALACISRAKWYTTKLISIPFAIWMFVVLFQQWKMSMAILTIIAVSVVLLIQMAGVFLNREFE